MLYYSRGKIMFDKYIYNFLYFVNHWSTKIVSWSWCKLYSNRKTGYGYRKRVTSSHYEIKKNEKIMKNIYES